MKPHHQRAALAVVLALLAVLVPLGLTAPAGAEPLPVDLELVSGTLDLRDSDEPADLERPTTFRATTEDSTGAISGGNFTAAPLSFSFDITTPIASTVYVDARFFQLTPGAARGSLNKRTNTEADVTVDIDVGVDLHVEVGKPAILAADCTSRPVSLRLNSTAPYSTETGRVTLQDADFAVPRVPTTNQCSDIIANGINERLAGGGHSITMDMTGALPLPRIGVYPTTTALTVTPETSRQGDEVTLTARVEPEPRPDAPDEPILGLVQFRDGATAIGEAAVDDAGVATLTTSALPVGVRSLTAVFRGDEMYASSESAAVEHLVAAAPTVALPDPIAPITIGSSPRPITVTIANPADTGAPIDDARLDLTIARAGGGNAVLDGRIQVEHHDGTEWVPLAASPVGATGVSVTVAGLDLPPGGSTAVRLRVRAPNVDGTPSPTACGAANPTCPGPLTIAASLATADGSRVLATDDGGVNLIERSRRATTAAFGGGVPQPHTARPGYLVIAPAVLSPTLSGIPWGGAVEVYLDGVQLPIRNTQLPHGEYRDQLPVSSAATQAHFLVPLGTDPGEHDVTIRYLGDAFRGPAEVTSQLYVHPSVGQPFVCQSVLPGTTSMILEWGASAVVNASVPSSATAGTQVAFEDAEVQLLMHRPGLEQTFSFVDSGQTHPIPYEGDTRIDSVSFDLDGRSTATATTVSLANKVRLTPRNPYPVPEGEVDQTLTFGGVSGVVEVEGELGDFVPVALSGFTVAHHLSNFPLSTTCTAVDEPATIADIEVAGTELTIDPSTHVVEGDDVTLNANTFPVAAPGTVTFTSDIDGEVGTATVTDGTATLVTDELTDGEHEITATFAPSDESPGSTSDARSLLVVPAPASDTEAFVTAALIDFTGTALAADITAGAEAIEAGQSKTSFLTELSRSDEYLKHVIDEMYRDTLGRGSDPAGLDFWMAKLRGGMPVATMAANFYGSNEYYNRAGGTDRAWVEALYEALLGRPADARGRDYWVGEIPKRGKGRVALVFFQEPESLAFRVTGLYEDFLDRRPNAADRTFWSRMLKSRGDLVLAVFLASSDEYAGRAENRFPVA